MPCLPWGGVWLKNSDMEIWIIQDLRSGSWPVATVLDSVLTEENGEEETILIDTDPVNSDLIKSLGVTTTPALVFIHHLQGEKYIVDDRIQGSVSKEALRSRYLTARSKVRQAGENEGQPDGERIDLSIPLDGKGADGGFGLLGLNLNLPWWLWFGVAAITAHKATETRNEKSAIVWWVATGAAVFNGLQKRKA